MSKTDVFIRVFTPSELRLGFAIATVARWRMQKDANVHILSWEDGIKHDWWAGHREGEYIGSCINVPSHPFSTWSLKMAEGLAKSDPYIICNDDNLPYGQDFIEKGLDLMNRYQDYGIISGMVVNENDYYKDAPEMTETHAVGGLVFLRKGLVTNFPPLEDMFWDGERHEQVVKKGFKSGNAKLPYLHMGARFSIASPAHFNGA